MSPLFRRTVRPFPSVSEHPDAAPSAVVRTYEGRPLTRQGEDLEDQGLTFDIATLATRRRFLGLLGAGATTAVLAACAAPAVSSPPTSGSGSTGSSSTSTATTGQEMPTETGGPYPGDGSNGPDVLEMTGVERSDIRSSIDGGAVAEGVPVTLTMNLIDMAGGSTPFAGAAVYLWHADARGRYSLYTSGVTDETYLRGVQVAGADGTVTFTTIFPGCYAGRWPHMHFEVFPDAASITDASNNVLTSQLALPGAESTAVYATSAYTGSAANLAGVTLQSDNVFSDGWTMQVPAVSGSVGGGYTMTIDVPIDTRTAQTAAGAPGRRP